jgi:hypothetical protein
VIPAQGDAAMYRASPPEVEQPAEHVDPELTLGTPSNLRWREEAELNSWFWQFSGDAAGHRIVFQVHCMVICADDAPPIVPIAISLTDETAGWRRAAEYGFPLAAVRISTTTLDIQAPNLSVSGDEARMTLHAIVPDGAIDIVIRNVPPPLYAGAAGSLPSFETYEGQSSSPTMETLGTVVIEGWNSPVSGYTRVDRQWFSARET